MKKVMKFLTVIGVLLMVGGGVLLCGGFLAGGKESATAAVNGNATVYSAEKRPLDDFTALDIHLDTLDLTIQPSDDDRAYLSYQITSASARDPLAAEVKNGVLSLRERPVDGNNTVIKQTLWLPGLSDFTDGIDTSVTLYLPARLLDEAAIELDIGSLRVDGLQAKTATIDLDVGACTLQRTTLGDAEVTLGVDDFSADALTVTGATTITSDTGAVDVTLADSDKPLAIDAVTDVGAIDVSEALGGHLLEPGNFSAHYQRSASGGAPSLTIHADVGDIHLQ